MKIPRLNVGLPLLTKELVEQSARKRTYVVRTLYAVLMFVSANFAFYDILGGSQADLFNVLGHGKRIFDFIVGIQFFGIYLFMPAISCSVLTTEKERNSLGLLFLTRLGPATIVVEKLLSRMVPMLTFLLLSLPLLAFAYSLGGITATYLWSGVWVLALTMLQICALAVMCSAFFRKTAGAFIAAYLIGLVLVFGLPVAGELGLIPLPHYSPSGVEDSLGTHLLRVTGIIGDGWQDISFMFFGPYVFYEHASNNIDFWTLVRRSIPMMFSTACFLLLARLFVVSRAFVPSRNYLMGLFRGIDGLFTRMNENRVTKGIVLVKESTALPDDKPVAWRETTKKSLGTVRYLFRILVATEVPVIVVCVLVVGVTVDVSGLIGISAMLFLLWFLAVLLVAVKATSLVSGERTHETLDVLLTTPLTARQIIQQKFSGVRRLMIVLAVPFVTIFLFEASWRGIVTNSFSGYGPYRSNQFSVLLYLTASLLSIFVYLPMIAWMSFLIGMLLRTQGRAIIASLGVIVFWCLAPLFLLFFLDEFFNYGFMRDTSFEMLLLMSPATIVPFNEFNEYHSLGNAPWTAVSINFVTYGACALVFRHLCLRQANRLLGRGDDDSDYRLGLARELQRREAPAASKA